MRGEKALREAGENYLETILSLEGENGDVRSVDVANSLGVSRPSVNKALRTLKEFGYVEQQPYGRIRLTGMGRSHAEAVTDRHRVLKRFLTQVLGVDADTADEDACRMEHIVSMETMAKLSAYTEKLA
jgi:Mn-dependent DtxR family transcriptional regulator